MLIRKFMQLAKNVRRLRMTAPVDDDFPIVLGDCDMSLFSIAEHYDIKELEIPKVICLCGSTRFKDAFVDANRVETLNGNIVLSVGLFGHLENLDMQSECKSKLDQLHFRKIDLADEILVLNVNGYLGESTRKEIEYATDKKIPVRYLEGAYETTDTCARAWRQ